MPRIEAFIRRSDNVLSEKMPAAIKNLSDVIAAMTVMSISAGDIIISVKEEIIPADEFIEKKMKPMIIIELKFPFDLRLQDVVGVKKQLIAKVRDNLKTQFPGVPLEIYLTSGLQF